MRDEDCDEQKLATSRPIYHPAKLFTVRVSWQYLVFG
jgi:hypothetical protein